MKAQENLQAAHLALQGKMHNACASRTYYAVFLASIAALIKLTSVRAAGNEWQHGQVQAELNRQLIMRRKILASELGRVPMDLSELGRVPMDLMELRHLADYKPQSVTAKEAGRAYNRSEKFLMAIEKALRESI